MSEELCKHGYRAGACPFPPAICDHSYERVVVPKWELMCVTWSQVGQYLQAGWEPFAVGKSGDETVVFLRRLVVGGA